MWGNELEDYNIKILLEEERFIKFTVEGYSIEHALEIAWHSNIDYMCSTGLDMTQKEFRVIVDKARDGKLKYEFEKDK